MQLGMNNPVLLSLRSNIDKMTSKKAFKTWKPELNKVRPAEQIIDCYGTAIECEVVAMLFDSVDWTLVAAAD